MEAESDDGGADVDEPEHSSKKVKGKKKGMYYRVLRLISSSSFGGMEYNLLI